MNYRDLENDLKKVQNRKKAEIYKRFFKTAKGQYGEGDKFLGLTVPQQRKLSLKYKDLSTGDLKNLLSSSIHEYRLTSLLILVNKYKKAEDKEKKEIFEFYIKNTKHINNWDLVDLSCPNIVGDYLLDKEKDILYSFSESNNLWKKRISVISTYTFIKNSQFEDTLKISMILLNDQHDLIHKAVGWMLREVGKRNQYKEEEFLKKYYKKMPRTMLRYAIEKFEERKRKFYLKKF